MLSLLVLLFQLWRVLNLLDSMIMNLEKGASVSLSEESDSFKICLNFLFEKETILVQCSPTHHGFQLEKGMNQGRNPFAMVEMAIQYQDTHMKSKILCLYQILVFKIQSNRVKKFFPLNTTDPQPLPSCTYKIKGWALFHRIRLDYMSGRK